MVIPLGPGKFYGSTLPRPRIYTDVKHSVERVDPPVPVMDPFLSWANEAHWSMGGLNFNRLRYQGRIEGNTEKLRKQQENKANLQAKSSPKKDPVPDGQKERNKKRGGSVSPPPAPKVAKKRRFLQLIDEESEEEDQEIEETVKVKRGLARKLVGDFERVAKENHNVKVPEEVRGVEKKSRGGKKDKKSGGESRSVKVPEEVRGVEKKSRGGKKDKKSGGESRSEAVSGGIRSSPRLAKRRSS